MTNIHPTAVVDLSAQLGEGCSVGPFAYVGPEVVLGDRCTVGPHCVIHGRVTLGSENNLISHVAVGGPPQDVSYAGEPTQIVIGDRNLFREFVTINRGTKKGGGITRLGSNILLMAYSHVAHDCELGDQVIFGNAATLAGHVHVGHQANIGAFSAVHQFCRVGDYAWVGAFSVITKDALPYVKTVGARGDAQIYGINTIGLERKGFSEETVDALKSAYRSLFQSKSVLKDALPEVERTLGHIPEVKYFVEFIRQAKRGIQR